jgi:hypothetical protein
MFIKRFISCTTEFIRITTPIDIGLARSRVVSQETTGLQGDSWIFIAISGSGVDEERAGAGVLDIGTLGFWGGVLSAE